MTKYYVNIEYGLTRKDEVCYCMTWFDPGFHLGPKVRGQLFHTTRDEYDLVKAVNKEVADSNEGYKLAKMDYEKYLTDAS